MLEHGHRPESVSGASGTGSDIESNHVLTIEEIHKQEEEQHHLELHPKTHLQLQMEGRYKVPAELRDHSKQHLPELVHMPDPFHRGIRGVHPTGEDWESESS